MHFIFIYVWFLAFWCIFFIDNFIALLISFEIMFLSICYLFCLFSVTVSNSCGIFMSFFILCIVAVETALVLIFYTEWTFDKNNNIE